MKLFNVRSFVTDSRLHNDTWGGQITCACDNFITRVAPTAMNVNAESSRSHEIKAYQHWSPQLIWMSRVQSLCAYLQVGLWTCQYSLLHLTCDNGSKLKRCQPPTYHTHITRVRWACGMWFISPRCGWQWPCEECFKLTTLQRKLLQLYCSKQPLQLSLGWQTPLMLQGVVGCRGRKTVSSYLERDGNAGLN